MYTTPYLSYNNNNNQSTLSSNVNNMMTLTNDASPYPSQRSLLSNIKDNDIYITPPLSSSNIISPLYSQSSIISINDDNNNNNNNNIYSSNSNLSTSNLSNNNLSTSNLSNSNLSTSNLSNSNLSNSNLSTNTIIPLNTIKNSSSRCPSFASVCNPHESDQFIPQNIDIPIEKSVLRRRKSKKQMFKTVPINNSTYSFNFEEKAISLLHFFENRRDPLDYRDSSIFPHGSMIYIRVTLPTNIKESLYLHIEKNSTFEELLEYVSKSLYNNPKYLSIYDYKWLDVEHEKREITMGISILNYLYSLITITKEDIKENLKENHSWMHLALRHKIHDNIRFYKHYESTYPCVTFSDPSSISICNPQNEQYTDLSYWITNEMEEKHYSNISLLTQLYYYNLSKPLSVISSSSTLQTPIISSPASTSSFDALDPSIFEIPLKNSQNQIINKVMEPVTFQYNLVLSQKQSDIDNIFDKYLSLYPQYYLHNTTNVQLLINFTDSDYYCYLPPKSCGPLHWISQSNSRELCITILQNTSNSSELSYSSNNIVPFNVNTNNNNNIYSNLSLKTNLWSFSYPFKIEETKKYSIRIPRQNKKEGTDAILTCDVMYTSSSSYILSFSFHHACISCVLRNYCYFPIQYAQIPPKEENRRIRNEYELLPANSYQDYIYKYNNDTDVSLMVLFPWESNKHCHQFNLEDENKSYTFKIDVKLPVTENILRTNIFRIYKNGIWVKRELVLCPEFLYIHKSNRKAGGRSMLQGIPLAEAEIILKSQIWNKQKKTEDDYDLQIKLDYISVESFSRGIEYPTLIQLRDICSKYDNPDELICTLFERRLICTQKSSDWRSKMIELSSSISLPSLVTFELKPSQVETTYIIIIKQDNRQFIFSSSDHDIMLKWAKDLRREMTVNVIKEGNDTIIEFRSGENQPRTYFGRKQRNKTVQDTEVGPNGRADLEDKENCTKSSSGLKLLSIGIGYIGLSLIDKTPEELLYVYFYNILGNYIYSKQQHNYSLSIDSLQIDVQTPTPLFPSMVYINRKSIQSISEGKNDSEMYRMINRRGECSGCGIEFKQNVPFLHICCTLIENNNNNTLYINDGYFSMEKLILKLDEQFILKLYRTFADVTQLRISTPSIFLSKNTHRTPLQQLLSNIYTERYIVLLLQKIERNKYVSIREIEIMPISIELTISTSPNSEITTGTSLTVTDKGVNFENRSMQIMSLCIKDSILTTDELWKRLFVHFKKQIILKVLSILTSTDYLGDFYYTISSIQKQLVSLNASEYDDGINLSKVGNVTGSIVDGIWHTTSKMSKGVGTVFTMITLDKDFKRERSNMFTKRNKNPLLDIRDGAEGFVKSVTSAVTGVVSQPMKGAKQQGFKGFMDGLGRCLIGVPMKPLVGLFDMASKTIEAVEKTTKKLFKLHKNDVKRDAFNRVRPPRDFKDGSILTVYNRENASAHQFLYFRFNTLYNNTNIDYYYDFRENDDDENIPPWKKRCIIAVNGLLYYMTIENQLNPKLLVALKLKTLLSYMYSPAINSILLKLSVPLGLSSRNPHIYYDFTNCAFYPNLSSVEQDRFDNVYIYLLE
ncbi:hypothetical protein WA158_000544 [Blastocystis sp. Blastoise]